MKRYSLLVLKGVVMSAATLLGLVLIGVVLKVYWMALLLGWNIF
jgi:hypothetical protein